MKIIKLKTEDLINEEIKKANELIKIYDNLFKTFLNLAEPIVSLKKKREDINLIVEKFQSKRAECSEERLKLQKIVKDTIDKKTDNYTHRQYMNISKQNKVVEKLIRGMEINIQDLQKGIINSDNGKTK